MADRLTELETLLRFTQETLDKALLLVWEHIDGDNLEIIAKYDSLLNDKSKIEKRRKSLPNES